MATAPFAASVVALLLPAAALAGEYDPNLHVDPSLDDCSVVFAPELTQSAFHRFAREFGSVSAFKQGAPSTTHGRHGFSASVEYISFRVEEKAAAWNDTFAHPDAYHELGADKRFPLLALRYGVTDDLDVGAFYAANPNANYGWLGVDAKYALVQQREDAPFSLSVRGAYTKTLYVSDMNMHAAGVDVTIGRTFWKIVTPYLGAGSDFVFARETSSAVDLHDEAMLVPHATAGFQVRTWHVAVGVEAQLSAALDSYQAQVSAVF